MHRDSSYSDRRSPITFTPVSRSTDQTVTTIRKHAYFAVMRTVQTFGSPSPRDPISPDFLGFLRMERVFLCSRGCLLACLLVATEGRQSLSRLSHGRLTVPTGPTDQTRPDRHKQNRGYFTCLAFPFPNADVLNMWVSCWGQFAGTRIFALLLLSLEISLLSSLGGSRLSKSRIEPLVLSFTPRNKTVLCDLQLH